VTLRHGRTPDERQKRQSTNDQVSGPAVQRTQPRIREPVPQPPRTAPNFGVNPQARDAAHVRSGVASPVVSVEVAGIEPASDGSAPGLLRVQPADEFLGPSDHAGKSLTGSVT